MNPTEIETLKLALDGLKLAIEVVGSALGLALAVIGWALNRGIRGVDAKLQDLGKQSSSHEGRLVRIETTLKLPPMS